MKLPISLFALACAMFVAAQDSAPAPTNSPAVGTPDIVAPPQSVADTNAPAPGTNGSAADTNHTASASTTTNESSSEVPAALAEAMKEMAGNSDQPETGYDLRAFRIIAERNIFNPNRSPRRDFTRTDRDRERESRGARTESFGLRGIMTYEKGQFAFFDGSSSDYRKVVEPAQTIAGYTVAAVLSNGVMLVSTNGEQVRLGVGMQMRRREDEPWRLGERGELSQYSSSTTSASSLQSSSNSTGEASSSGDGGEDEILKRLLQKREEELK